MAAKGQAAITMSGTLICAVERNSCSLPVRRRALLSCLLLCLSAPALAGAAERTDGREVFTGNSKPWLQAIGKLRVPGQRHRDGHTSHYVEDCSATLLALPGRPDADIIVTAWHCLELYGDLSRAITFTARSTSGELLERHARRLEDGGGMAADWAILRLQTGIPRPQVAALQPHPTNADPGRPVTMAGYSRDTGIGDGGRVLSFHPDCAITGSGPGLGETDCTAFKGASGGAVIQLSRQGEPLVCGVISQGNGNGRSTYVPLETFRKSLARYLR